MDKQKIYIASPYTLGKQTDNVKLQLDAFDTLLKAGHTPFAPLFLHYLDIVHPQQYDVLLDWCLQWLVECDLLIRFRSLDGDNEEIYSYGADIEMTAAEEYNIPVYEFRDLNELKNSSLIK